MSKPNQILYCPKCKTLLTSIVYSRIRKPCCTEYGTMISYVVEDKHVLKRHYDELQSKLSLAVAALGKIANHVNKYSDLHMAIGAYAALQIVAKETLEALETEVDGD